MLGQTRVILAVVGSGLVMPTIAFAQDKSKVPTKDYAATYFQSFKGSEAKPEGWEITSETAEPWVHFEKAGLRLTLPPGWPDERPAAGIWSVFGVRGDFEITMQFEILKEPVLGKFGMRLSLAVDLDTPLHGSPNAEMATLNRTQTQMGQPSFLTWMRNRERPKSIANGSPTTATAGRLRLVRSGDVLYYLVSVGADQPFKLLNTYRFGVEDLKLVGITATTIGEKSEVDLRITDLYIRADAIPDAPPGAPVVAGEPRPLGAAPPPEGGHRWLVTTVILAAALVLVVIVAVGAWFFLRKPESVASTVSPRPAPTMVSFACPECEKPLKAKAALAGKRVKCARCGTPVLVPIQSEAAE